MELNITLTELALFTWAIIATAAAFKFKEEVDVVKNVIIHLLENDSARDKLVEAHKNFVKEKRS